jgi:hypothetical protein
MNTRVSLGLLYVLSLLLLVVSIGCDDESFEARQSAVIEVAPNAFRFPAAQMGETAIEKIVIVKNVGASDLLLAQITARFSNAAAYELDYRTFDPANDTSEGGDFFVGIDVNGNNFPDNISVPPAQSLALKLRYTPDGQGASGLVEMTTNAEPSELQIPIEGVASRADVVVSPALVDFGRVNVGDTKVEELTLTNVGSGPALISQIFLNAREEYAISLDEVDVIGSVADIPTLQDPDGDGEPGLSPMSSVTFNVTYTPVSENSLPGEVVFALTGAIQDSITVNLSANGASPCLNILFPDSVSSDSSTLQFGPALIGATTPSEVIIESCGGQQLDVSSITYEGAPEFALDEDAMPFSLAGRTDVRPSRSFTVNFSPTDAEVYEGTMIIASNDPANPELRIPVLGRGTVNACPEAVVTTSSLNVLPLEIITLDGSNSVDVDGPNGMPVSYGWVVVSRPEGSTAQPVERFFNPLRPADGGEADDMSTPSAQFFVDLAGEYVFNLVVTDDLGFAAPSNSCPQMDATILVSSLPDEDIHVELTWTTPGDPNETDTEGTDVDLHFRHPNGQRWNQSPWDCYFANPNPDWGPTGPVGNPSLDIDDVNGAGPENINLNDPEFTDQTTLPGPYLVGVHYYGSGGLFTTDYGPSEATIRLYLGGVLAGTYTQVLNATNNFWEVAGIIWTASEQRAQEINRFYDVAPW